MTTSKTDLKALLLAVRDAHGLRGGAKAVLFSIVTRVDWTTGTGCTASTATIGKGAGVSGRTARTALRALESHGIIRTQLGGGDITNTIDIDLDVLSSASNPRKNLPAPPRQNLPTTEEESSGHPGKKRRAPRKDLPPILEKKPSQISRRARVAFPVELDTPAVRTAWFDWEQHRRELKKPKMTPTAAKALLVKLAEWGPDRAAAAIHHSILKNWKDIYEAKVRDDADAAPGLAGPDLDPPRNPTTAELAEALGEGEPC